MNDEYNKLSDNIYNMKKSDIIISKIEGSDNQVAFTRYGITTFPYLALFSPFSKKPNYIYNGHRLNLAMTTWLVEKCIPLNSTGNDTKYKFDSLDNNTHIKAQNITDDHEFIVNEYYTIKKRLGDLEKELFNIQSNSVVNNKGNFKIIVKINISDSNIWISVILIIGAVLIYIILITFKNIRLSFKGDIKNL